MIRNAGFLTALVTFGFTFAWAQPAFLRKDIQVPGQYGNLETQVRIGSLSVGDYNGDGRPDLLVSSLRGIDVLLNLGGGTFGRPLHTDPVWSWEPVTADFNGDGKLDLVIPSPGRVIGRVLLGRGDGTFLPPRDLSGVGMAVAGDVNNDGKADLLIQDGSFLRILLGNGDGTFRSGATIRQYALSQTNHLAIADFNGDGRVDLAVNDGDPWVGYSVSIFLGNGDGSFQARRSTSVHAATLLVADLNGDGLPDLITGYDILVGRGDGSFEPPRPYFNSTDAAVVPVPFAAADFDGDGHPDLAVGSRYLYAVDNHVLIFRGKGDGTMLPPTQYEVGWQPAAGAVADLDGDGQPDLAAANLASNTVSLLLSSGAGDSTLVRAVSAASGAAVVTPSSLATLYNTTTVGVALQATSIPWPTSLGGNVLEIHDGSGAFRMAPLLYISGNQINFLLPEKTALGEATLELVRGNSRTQVGTMQVAAVAPALFLATDYSLTPVAFVERIQPDGSRTSQPLFKCSGPNSCAPVRVEAPPEGTKEYLLFYGTGFRNATPENVKCFIAGWGEFPVDYVGPSDEAGLDRLSVRLEFSPGDDFWRTVYFNPMQEIGLSIDGVLSNRALLFFSAPEPPCISCK
jgi:uncharacterized protein (TIGR03437 family)